MSNTIRTNALAAFTFFAFLFAAAAGVVEGQSDTPIEDEDILACVTVDETVWAAPVALKNALENLTGQSATVESTEQLINRLPRASSTNGVRFEGGQPTPNVVQDLESLGYQTLDYDCPHVPGANTAYEATL